MPPSRRMVKIAHSVLAGQPRHPQYMVVVVVVVFGPSVGGRNQGRVLWAGVQVCVSGPLLKRGVCVRCVFGVRAPRVMGGGCCVGATGGVGGGRGACVGL